MIHSMTGYGAASGHVGGAEHAIELRSVNNRYFKTDIRLPETLAGLGPQVEKYIRERVHRGTVLVKVYADQPGQEAAEQINLSVVEGYVNHLMPLLDKHPSLHVDLAGLLELPGATTPRHVDPKVLENRWRDFQPLLNDGLDQLLTMRRREGRALEEDLAGHVEHIQRNLARVADRAPRVIASYRERLAERLAPLLEKDAHDPENHQDILREVALFAERCDISEEIARLRSHLEQFSDTFKKEDAIGRTLDFIAQEMLREANTIASKANDAEMACDVVEIKSAIDRIKEQSQNVE